MHARSHAIAGPAESLSCLSMRVCPAVQVSDRGWRREVRPGGRGADPAREEHSAGELCGPGGLQPGAGHYHPGGILQVIHIQGTNKPQTWS